MTPDTLRATVRDTYAAVARGEALSCCSPTDGATEINMIGDAYDGVEGYVADADLKLGCGLPVEHAGLAPGQTVLDLGAGAGLDAFVARRIVGEAGRVLGVDFTPEMVEKARANAAKLGYGNVAFEHGDIESLPFADASVDVVISNCVLNLVPDKARAFAEMARVLRPGGHFCVSDVVTRGDLPDAVRDSAELYAGCVAGALDESDYLGLLREAGFEAVEVVQARPIALPGSLLPDAADVPLWSVTVRGTRPASAACSLDHTNTHPPGVRPRDVLLDRRSAARNPTPRSSSSPPTSKRSPPRVSPSSDSTSRSGPRRSSPSPPCVTAIETLGTGVLPLVVRDGQIVSHSRYPSLAELRMLATPESTPELPFSLNIAPGCAPDSGCC